MGMNDVQVSDNVFSQKNQDLILNYCEDCSYTYGETDDGKNPPTGMVHNIPKNEKVYELFAEQIAISVPETQNMHLYRMYVNCFAPSENPYFHTDWEEGGVTFLYYPTEKWNYNDGGETQFVVDGEIYGVVPLPNRLVYFDANILHRATAFRDKHRFTIAVKYIPV